MDLKVLTLRNKVEDMKCVPIYLKTAEMIADIGTKALDPSKAVLLPAGQVVWVLERGKRIDRQGGTISRGLAPLEARHRSNTRDM